MWEAIKYVSGFASLLAFIAACVFTYFNYQSRQETNRLRHVPDDDKIRALDAILNRFHVDTTELNQERKFQLAMEQIRNERRKYSWKMSLFALITVLFSVLWFISITYSKAIAQPFTFQGFIVYEDPRDPRKEGSPVNEAEVKISGSELRGKTDSSGKFIIGNVPVGTSVKEIVVNHGGKPHTLQTKDFPNNVFRIPEVRVVKSIERSISSEDWKLLPSVGCQPRDKYLQTAQVSLTKDVHREGDYSDLLLRIRGADHVDIISARKLHPLQGVKVRDEEDYSKAQKWQFPVTGDKIRISVSLCLGATSKESLLSKADLYGTYWFEKVE